MSKGLIVLRSTKAHRPNSVAKVRVPAGPGVRFGSALLLIRNERSSPGDLTYLDEHPTVEGSRIYASKTGALLVRYSLPMRTPEKN
jgi:hypothetical protein